jgi:hypothetical protein
MTVRRQHAWQYDFDASDARWGRITLYVGVTSTTVKVIGLSSLSTHQQTALSVFMRNLRNLRIINFKIRIMCIMSISCVYFFVKFAMSENCAYLISPMCICVFYAYFMCILRKYFHICVS